MFGELLSSYFSGLGEVLSRSFVRHVGGVISSCSSSTYEISRHVSMMNGKDFNSNEKNLIYLLSNKNFKINDKYWRMHSGMVFDLMLEQEFISHGDRIPIQVDFTTDKNDFLMLSASIIVKDRSVPLYFSMRNYPDRKGSYDHKNMEMAFLKALKHILSKRFSYIIVADRGFGNDRFIGLCEKVGFDYMIRLEPNMLIESDSGNGIMENAIRGAGVYDIKVKRWSRNLRIFMNRKNSKSWYIASNIKDIDHESGIAIYKDRFKIEKCFQDLKSSGFDIENSKIKKYDRFKRLVAMCMVAHVILVMIGNFVKEKLPHILKNSPLHGEIILAFLLSENKQSHTSPILKYATYLEN